MEQNIQSGERDMLGEAETVKDYVQCNLMLLGRFP